MNAPEERIYRVDHMSCDHCRVAVTAAVAGLAGVQRVEVELASGRMRVLAANVDDDAIVATVTDEGYAVAS
jgi:copper chaperone CopZ